MTSIASSTRAGIRSQQFHQSYLKITALIVIAYGPIFFFGSLLATSEPARWTMDLVRWPLDGAQDFLSPTTRLLSALAGGTLMGWGILIWCLATWVYRLAPELVRRIVVASVLIWFVFDSVGSLFSGHPLNVLINVLFLVIGLGPLWLPAKD